MDGPESPGIDIVGKLFRFLFFGVVAATCAAAPAGRLAPLNGPVPFAPEGAPSVGQPVIERLAADRAEALGLPSVAAALYRRLLSEPGADRAGLGQALATALLDAGEPSQAQAALAAAPGPKGSSWHLLAALAAADLRLYPAARAEAAAVKPAELRGNESAWWVYLQGILAAASGNADQARALFRRAVAAAGNTVARTTFLIADAREEIGLGQPSRDTAVKLAASAAQLRGTAKGYDAERAYALSLFALGRRADAVAALEGDLRALPASEKARADDFRWLIGLIAGAGRPDGRSALIELLESGADPDGPDRQRMALELLAGASRGEPERSAFRAELDRLIAAPRGSDVVDDLLLFRADLEVGDRDYTGADADAARLLEAFPGSALVPYALAVRTTVAWDQARYRAAATLALQTHDAFPQGQSRSLLGVVAAEAWFRAREYRAAADAYAAALRNPPAGMLAGDLIFQRIESEILAGALDAARTALDRAAGEPAFSTADRWKAEYNLARELELDHRSEQAYGRVSGLLAAASPPGFDPALRGRMAWLQAELAYDAGHFERALDLAAALPGRLARVAEPLRSDLAATGELLRAKALFNLGRQPEAFAVLQAIGAEYPATQAAVEAYLVEAEDDAAQDRTVQAERVYLDVVKRFPQDAVDASYALLQAAYLAESLGQPNDFEQGIRWIEQMVTTYPGSDLVFEARLEEGDLYRDINQFPQAEQIYEGLIRNDSRDPDVILARLALADCHNEAAASDLSQQDSAISLYENLLERIDAPIDIRVEAGYKLGNLYERLKRPDDAYATWFGEVVQPFLLDPKTAAALGSRGRHWMARTLLDLGALLAREGHPDEARQAWNRLIQAGLPGLDLARSDLGSLSPEAPGS